MSDEQEFAMPTPDPALKRLDFLVGTWKMSGRTEEGPMGPATEMSGVEKFEWMEGGFFLVHTWRGTMEVGGAEVIDTGYEFFDFDPETQQYRTHFFNSFGPYEENGSKYIGKFDDDNTLVLTGPARFVRRLNADGTIAYDCDVPGEDGSWSPYMHATLSKS